MSLNSRHLYEQSCKASTTECAEDACAAALHAPGVNVLPLCVQAGIFGHSMGGHGALTIFLKNSGAYKSVSAFAPIVNPVNVPWGKKAFSGYLGKDEATWKQYDATELVKQYKGPKVPVLIDVGTADNFKDEQLTPEIFEEAAAGKLDVRLRLQVIAVAHSLAVLRIA